MHVSEEIGSRLRDERKRCGFTQDQIADAIGISKRTQANYESGASDAPALYLNLALGLGFDVMYILTGDRTTIVADSLSETEDLIVKQYRIIPEEDQRALRRFLKAMVDDIGNAPES